MDFDRIQKSNQERGAEARMNADDGVQPEIGKTYTVSPSFKNGDRSWVGDFWTVVGFSGPNVLVRISETYREHLHLCIAEERAWYPADELFEAWQAEKAQAAS